MSPSPASGRAHALRRRVHTTLMGWYGSWAQRHVGQAWGLRWRGLTLSIPVGVFHPTVFFSSTVLAAEIERRAPAGFTVLDVGCGSGLLSLAAVRAGAVVTAVDINDAVVAVTSANALANALLVETLRSDLSVGLSSDVSDVSDATVVGDMRVVDVSMGAVSFRAEERSQARYGSFWATFAVGTFELATVSVLEAELGPGRRFLDIGAWIGPFTVLAAALGAQVTAFEPDPVAVAALDLEGYHVIKIDIEGGELDLVPRLGSRLAGNRSVLFVLTRARSGRPRSVRGLGPATGGRPPTSSAAVGVAGLS